MSALKHEAAVQRDAVGDLRENFAVAANDQENSGNSEKSQRLISDREILAFEAIAENALVIAGAAAVVHIAATQRDKAAVEGYLWYLRRELKATIEAWHAAVPPFEKGGDDD